jgi:hypothetical protein
MCVMHLHCIGIRPWLPSFGNPVSAMVPQRYLASLNLWSREPCDHEIAKLEWEKSPSRLSLVLGFSLYQFLPVVVSSIGVSTGRAAPSLTSCIHRYC